MGVTAARNRFEPFVIRPAEKVILTRILINLISLPRFESVPLSPFSEFLFDCQAEGQSGFLALILSFSIPEARIECTYRTFGSGLARSQ